MVFHLANASAAKLTKCQVLVSCSFPQVAQFDATRLEAEKVLVSRIRQMI